MRFTLLLIYFRKVNPYSTEMKNVACSRLGTVLHLDIQKEKEAIKTSTFQKYLGGTVARMKIRMIYTKGCGQLTSNDTYSSFICSSREKTNKEDMDEGLDYSGLV